MTVVALAHCVRPEQLLSHIARHAAPGATVISRATDWGAFAVVDSPSWTVGRWLVAGMPQAHPWGVPIADLPGNIVASELERFGPGAIQMTAGPLVAIDMSLGAVLRAVNGIMPLTVSVTGPFVASTSAHVVASLSGGAGRSVSPGFIAFPDGTEMAACGMVVRELLARVSWAGIEAEVARQLASLGPLRPANLPLGPRLKHRHDEFRSVRIGKVGNRPIFIPRFSTRAEPADALSRYLRLREWYLPSLWWRARLVGSWLCAPAFERPSLDLVKCVEGSPTAEMPET